MTETCYAIGDIHGQLQMLKQAHKMIAEDQARHGLTDAQTIHVGDLVDRGPDSAGVIDHLITGVALGQNWITLKGNHDRMFQIFLQDPSDRDPCLRPEYTWLHPRLGGLDTLASYGIDVTATRDPLDLWAEAKTKVPQPHQTFLKTMPLIHLRPNLAFVHAGIRPSIALENQTEDDLLWIRQAFHDDASDHGRLIIHGHTPIDTVTHYGNRINIDTGAGFGRPLSTIVLQDGPAFTLTDQGRIPLAP